MDGAHHIVIDHPKCGRPHHTSFTRSCVAGGLPRRCPTTSRLRLLSRLGGLRALRSVLLIYVSMLFVRARPARSWSAAWKLLLEYVSLAFCWTQKCPPPRSFNHHLQHTRTLLDHPIQLPRPALILHVHPQLLRPIRKDNYIVEPLLLNVYTTSVEILHVPLFCHMHRPPSPIRQRLRTPTASRRHAHGRIPYSQNHPWWRKPWPLRNICTHTCVIPPSPHSFRKHSGPTTLATLSRCHFD